HRNQYELITEAFLAGQLHFQYDNIDPRLLAMENPYDAATRDSQGIYYYWDHAFYDGQYYMYFGVVPVLLAFLPYRLITGQALTGYHVTQVFTALHIAGLFALLWLVGKKHFRHMPLALYVLFCSALSYISVWNAVATPALYSMCIVCALGLAVWSLYCFARAVWVTKSENRAIALAALGSLLGALEFGCRPTVGLSNIVVLPLLIAFLRRRRITPRLILKLILAALPYALVAAGLLWYNAARFDNPFEFGQSYQLTVTDQSAYGDMLSRLNPAAMLDGMRYYLLNINTPTIVPSLGLLIAFPLLPAAAALLLARRTRRNLAESRLTPLLAACAASVLVIMVFELLWAPHPTPRYRMDFAWLLGLAVFLPLGCACREEGDSPRFLRTLGALCLLAMAMGVLMALYPQGKNFTDYYAADIKAFLGL
ncbi:MAG: hypothetical protein Q4A66_11925, partial [Eubacteriales bacterium]|nr:hypothetical protein [Eubacteriales bacterium]